MAYASLDLVGAFDVQCGPELRRQLEFAKTPEDTGRAVSLALAPLLDPQGPAIGALPRESGLAVRALLGVVMQGCDLPLRGLPTDPVDTQAVLPGTSNAVLAAVTGSAAAAALATNMLAWSLSPLIGIPVGIVGGLAVSRVGGGATLQRGDPTATPLDPEVVVAATRELLSQVQSFAERSLLAPPPPEKRINEFEGLMELLQGLLSEPDGDDADPLGRARKQAMRLLMRHDITAHAFDAKRDGAMPDPERWIVDPAPLGATTATQAPLLCRGDAVVRRGRVSMVCES